VKAYVYTIIVDGVIRYIGKGSGNRVNAHLRVVRSIAWRRAAGETVKASHFYNRLTKAWLAGSDIQASIISELMSDEQAYAREIAEIAAAPKGQLWNIWAGGEGSSKGYLKSDEQRKLIAESNRKTWTDPDLKQKQSEAKRIHWLRPEYRELVKIGRAKTDLSPEGRARRRAAANARWADPSYREKMRLLYASEEYKLKLRARGFRAWKTRRARQKEISN
jgi:hypothetical protein